MYVYIYIYMYIHTCALLLDGGGPRSCGISNKTHMTYSNIMDEQTYPKRLLPELNKTQ